MSPKLLHRQVPLNTDPRKDENYKVTEKQRLRDCKAWGAAFLLPVI